MSCDKIADSHWLCWTVTACKKSVVAVLLTKKRQPIPAKQLDPYWLIRSIVLLVEKLSGPCDYVR